MRTQYTPSYPHEITTKTSVERVNTMHTDSIDWEYPFAAIWEESSCRCYSSDPEVKKNQQSRDISLVIERLKTLEANPGRCLAGSSEYGNKVLCVGMASAWPYWRPRPTVLVSTHMGTEWIDWMSLALVKIRKEATK